MDFLKKNRDLFAEKKGDQVDFNNTIDDILHVDEASSAYEISQHTDMAGNPILCIKTNEHDFFLTSKVDAQMAAAAFCTRYSHFEPYTYIVQFGLSDGRISEQLLSNMSEKCALIIYEPDSIILKNAFMIRDFEPIISDERCTLLCSEDSYDLLESIIRGFNSVGQHNHFEYIITPLYDILYNEECRRCMDIISDSCLMGKITTNTYAELGLEMITNLINNMPDILESYDTAELCRVIKNTTAVKEGEVPFIIVAAGPSLDINIDDLKLAEGKAFIMATDSAMKALRDHDIDFQMGVCADPHKPERLFDHNVLNKPIMTDAIVPNYVIRADGAKRFVFYDDEGKMISTLIKSEDAARIPSFSAGGSVATMAFVLGVAMGFKKIIFVGQDLAYKGESSHVKGYYEGDKENASYLEKKEMEEYHHITVEGIDGSLLTTNVQFYSYLRWFERQFYRLRYEIEIIDATEGGAKKKYCTHMPLKEALDLCCLKQVDFDKIINDIPKIFTDAKKEEILEYYKTSIERTRQIRKKLCSYERSYQKLGLMIQNRKSDTKAFSDEAKKVEDVFEYTSKSSEMHVIRKLSTSEMLKIDSEEKEPENLKKSVSKAADIISAYIAGADRLLKVFKDSDFLGDEMQRREE